MHETERHRVVLSAVQERLAVTVRELVALTGSSEATIRRDIATLHMQQQLRRPRQQAGDRHHPRRRRKKETLLIRQHLYQRCGDNDP